MKRPSGKKRLVKNLSHILLITIIVYATIYSIVFVGGPSFYGDDTVYLSLANSMLQNSFHQGPFIFSVRLLAFMPIAFFYALFGVSMYTSSAWGILSFLLTIVTAFLLGRELYDDRAGLFAALLLTFFPLAAELAPTVSDDIPMMFLTSLAMLFLVLAQKRNSRLMYGLCGVAVVASQLITPESIVIIFVLALFLVVEFFRKKLRSNVSFLFYGFVFAGGVLLSYNAINSGDPFVTITTTLHFYSAVGGQNTIPSTNTDPNFYIRVMFPYDIVNVLSGDLHALNFNPISIWQQIYVVNYNQSGFYFYALAIAAFYVFYRKESSSYIPLLWFFAGFLYLEFGPMHVSLYPFQYLLAYRLQRFLLFLSMPLVLIIGMALSKAIGKHKGVGLYATAVVAALVLLFLVSTAIPLNILQYQQLSYERYDQLAIATYLNTLPSTTTVYRASGFSNLDSYMMFSNPSRLIAYDSIQNCNSIPAGVYVVIPKNVQEYGLNYTPDPTRYCPNWRLVLYPQYPASLPSYITSTGASFQAKLYMVPGNNAVAAQSTTNNSAPSSFNYFNLTGAGYFDGTSNTLNLVTVNRVDSILVSLSRNATAPGTSSS